MIFYSQNHRIIKWRRIGIHLFRNAIFIFPLLLFGCKKDNGNTHPNLVINPLEQFFTLENPGDSHVFKFDLHNRGNSILKINDFKKSCGCVAIDVSATEIHPGEHAKLNLVVSQDRYGMVSQWALLKTNEPEGNALHKLKVTTEVIPKLVLTPSKISVELYPEDTVQRVINVNSYTNTKINRLEKNADWITSLNYNDANSIIVNISAQSLKRGEYNDSITIYMDTEEEKQIPIPIHMRVLSRVSVIPEFLFLGNNFWPSESYSPRSIKISILGKSPSNIAISMMPQDLLSYEIKKDTGYAEVFVKLSDSKFRGAIDAQMRIVIEDEYDFMIPIKGYVQH